MDQYVIYRSVVGMLLYLINNLLPDIENSVRKLLKVLDEPSVEEFHEILCTTNYVFNTHYFGLKFKPTDDTDNVWILQVYSDSDYTGDKDTCLSIGGYVLYIGGVLDVWILKSQHTIMLSSAEAGRILASKAVKEVIFVLQLLQSMIIKVKLPIIVYMDNIVAVFMASNKSTSYCIKYVHIHTKYVS